MSETTPLITLSQFPMVWLMWPAPPELHTAAELSLCSAANPEYCNAADQQNRNHAAPASS